MGPYGVRLAGADGQPGATCEGTGSDHVAPLSADSEMATSGTGPLTASWVR